MLLILSQNAKTIKKINIILKKILVIIQLSKN